MTAIDVAPLLRSRYHCDCRDPRTQETAPSPRTMLDVRGGVYATQFAPDRRLGRRGRVYPGFLSRSSCGAVAGRPPPTPSRLGSICEANVRRRNVQVAS